MGWLPKPSDKEREREKEKEKEREKEKEKEREREKEKEKDSQVSQDDLGQNLRKVIDGIMGHSVLMSHLFSQVPFAFLFFFFLSFPFLFSFFLNVNLLFGNLSFFINREKLQRFPPIFLCFVKLLIIFILL